MLPFHLNIAVNNYNVGKIERSVRTTKKLSRCMAHGIPFEHIPRLMIRSMVLGFNTSMNDIPAVDVVSDILSPTTIVVGYPRPDYNVITRILLGVLIEEDGIDDVNIIEDYT